MPTGDVLIDAIVIPNWHYPNATVELQIDISEAFTATDGTPIQPGDYLSVICTPDLNAFTLSIPAFHVFNTTNGQDKINCTYSAKFYDGTNHTQKIADFANYQAFSVSATPTETTWASLANKPPGTNRYDFTAFMRGVVDTLYSRQTFVDGDTTPSVAAFYSFKTANTATTLITNFDNGYDGKTIWVLINDSHTSIFGTHYTLGDFLSFQYDGTTWRSAIPVSASGVTSFNGRNGAVVPVDGDYFTVNTPVLITANQNNYAPSSGFFQRWSSNASRNITGMLAPSAGQQREIWNVGSNNIVLIHESSLSTAANRFTVSTGEDLTVEPNQSAVADYDAVTSRWRIQAIGAGGGGNSLFYDLAVDVDGAPAANQTVFRFVACRAFTLGLSASQGLAGVAATAQTDFLVTVNGVTKATIRFAIGGTVATIVSPTSTGIVPGDIVRIIAPASPDATLANIAFTLDATTSGSSEPYDASCQIDGIPTASQIVLKFVAVRGATFPMSGSTGAAAFAATADTDFLVKVNGITEATLRFAAGQTVATVVSPSSTPVNAGDVVTIVAPAVPDATLANIALTLKGTTP